MYYQKQDYISTLNSTAFKEEKSFLYRNRHILFVCSLLGSLGLFAYSVNYLSDTPMNSELYELITPNKYSDLNENDMMGLFK